MPGCARRSAAGASPLKPWTATPSPSATRPASSSPCADSSAAGRSWLVARLEFLQCGKWRCPDELRSVSDPGPCSPDDGPADHGGGLRGPPRGRGRPGHRVLVLARRRAVAAEDGGDLLPGNGAASASGGASEDDHPPA